MNQLNYAHNATWLGVAVVVLLIALSLLVGWKAHRWWRGRSVGQRTRRALQKERDAYDVLEARGYRVLQAQAVRDWRVVSGQNSYNFKLRADFIVERRGRVFVADAKTGAAACVRAPHTRRQLLEYLVAYQTDGVLLVDMEQEQVLEVEFVAAPQLSLT